MPVRGSEVGMAAYLRSRRIIPLLAVLSVVSVLASCAAVRPSDWIRVGSTTQAEVVAQYGEPDLIRVMPEGEVAVYRQIAPAVARPRLSVPVVEAAGDLGAIRTREQPIERGLGVRGVGTGARARPEKEFRIRFDRNGVVQALEE
jgi:hypothetical protein